MSDKTSTHSTPGTVIKPGDNRLLVAEHSDEFIRVHTSDTATFKRCRRRWDWTSPMRGNLRPKVASAGINFNLAFGTMVHRALEEFYAEERDPAKVFEQHWLLLIERVKELNEGFFNENEEEFEQHWELGVGMLKYYMEWAQQQDDFIVIATEHPFEVDIGLVARDITTGEQRRVKYCGRMDLIIQDRKTGRYGIMDHKTSSYHDDEDFFTKLELDEQVTRYMWAAQLEAEQQDLPYKKIDYVLYNVLFKGYPKPPTILKNDLPSVNRQTESTTLEMFKECVLGHPLRTEWFTRNDKAQAYYQYLADNGSRRFTRRELVKRNDYELVACGERVLAECRDMLSPDLRVYPNATGEWYCIRCPFRGPCIATNDGSDVSFMLDVSYEPNMDEVGNYTLGV